MAYNIFYLRYRAVDCCRNLVDGDIITSPPQSHLGRVRRYPHVEEFTLPLCVLAVALQCVPHRYWTLWNVEEASGKCYGVLRSVTEHYGALLDVTRRYGSVADRYGTLRERYGALTERYGTVTENIDFAYH